MLRRLAALALLFVAFNARATTFSTDASDLWWNPNESGWGLNIAQQGPILFMTMFVYGADGKATWFVGPDVEYNNISNGQITYTGALYQTTGPVFSSTFNPNNVGVTQVGNITIVLTTVANASLTYSVNGTLVVKQIQRQTWVINNVNGGYFGGMTGTYVGSCPATGYQEKAGTIAITQTQTNISIAFTSGATTCTYASTYTQDGRMGSSLGSYTCTDGTSGTFKATEIEGSISALGMMMTTTSGGCGFTGHMGGVFRGP